MIVKEWSKTKEEIYNNDNEIECKMISSRLLISYRVLYALFFTYQPW